MIDKKQGKRAAAPQVIVIASSTGGPLPLRLLLSELPPDLPVPLVIAQHFVPGFEDGLVSWLSRASQLEVRLAKMRDALVPGVALIGRPDTDVVIFSRSALRLHPMRSGGFHPSADELFASAASVFGDGALAVVLSGVGRQGTDGARAVVAAGGRVFSQDRESAAASSMPAEIARHGLASVVAPPRLLARAIRAALSQGD